MKRIRCRRIKGWKMPPNTIYVGRPTWWGNPFRAGEVNWNNALLLAIGCRKYRIYGLYIKDEKMALEWYKKYLKWAIRVGKVNLQAIKGKNLACWCGLDAKFCHADYLLELLSKKFREQVKLLISRHNVWQ